MDENPQALYGSIKNLRYSFPHLGDVLYVPVTAEIEGGYGISNDDVVKVQDFVDA